MQHMPLVQQVDVLARDHVDLRVPVRIQLLQLRKLLLLMCCQVWKITGDDLDHGKMNEN